VPQKYDVTDEMWLLVHSVRNKTTHDDGLGHHPAQSPDSYAPTLQYDAVTLVECDFGLLCPRRKLLSRLISKLEEDIKSVRLNNTNSSYVYDAKATRTRLVPVIFLFVPLT